MYGKVKFSQEPAKKIFLLALNYHNIFFLFLFHTTIVYPTRLSTRALYKVTQGKMSRKFLSLLISRPRFLLALVTTSSTCLNRNSLWSNNSPKSMISSILVIRLSRILYSKHEILVFLEKKGYLFF